MIALIFQLLKKNLEPETGVCVFKCLQIIRWFPSLSTLKFFGDVETLFSYALKMILLVDSANLCRGSGLTGVHFWQTPFFSTILPNSDTYLNSEPISFYWRGHAHNRMIKIYEGSSFLSYRKVARSRPVYYSILNSLRQRSQYISIKFPLHKQSENTWVCY